MGDRERLTDVRVSAELGAPPFWILTTHEPMRRVATADDMTNEFAVPEDVSKRFAKWDAEFQATYDADDPASSGFLDEQNAQRWNTEGLAATRALAAALGPTIRVEYVSDMGSEVFSTGDSGDS